MSELVRKLKRITRIRGIEQRNLELLSIELNNINAAISKQEATLESLRSRIDNHDFGNTPTCIEQVESGLAWLTQLEIEAAAIANKIAELNRLQEIAQLKVVEQRAKVRGWDLHVERLSAENAAEIQNQEALDADDRYLNSSPSR